MSEDLKTLTDAEFIQHGAKVVAHLCEQVRTVVSKVAKLYDRPEMTHDETAAAVLFGTVGQAMDYLGDLLECLDAATEDDEWTDPIFEELHRRCNRGKQP